FMRPFRSIMLLALIPALAFLLAGPGCSSKGKKPPRPAGDLEEVEGEGGKSAEPAKTEVAGKGWGTVEGFVSYEGEPPKVGTLVPEMEKHQDKAKCLAGKPDEKSEQTWIIGPNKGVANVCIFLKVPEGKYFKVADEDKKRM